MNDEVFVEDVVQYDPVSTGGTGFNSADVGYRFAKVTAYTEAASGRSDSVTIDFAGLSTNTGIAVTNQGSVASLINKNHGGSGS